MYPVRRSWSRPVMTALLLPVASPAATAADTAMGGWYVIESTPVDLRKEAEERDRHIQRQRSLEADGTLVLAGGAVAEDGSRVGLIVVRADSFTEARRIADADPMHRSGARSYRIRLWTVKEGSLSTETRLSDGSGRIR